MPYDNTEFAYNGRVNKDDLRDPRIARIIAARFKEAKRKHKTYTQETNKDVARICGMSEAMLAGHLYCAPPVTLSVDRYTMLARYFGESPEMLLEMPDEWELEPKEPEAANDDEVPQPEPLIPEREIHNGQWIPDAELCSMVSIRAETMSMKNLEELCRDLMAVGWSRGTQRSLELPDFE